MFHEIPLKTNFYNFTQGVTLGGRSFLLRFSFLSRRETYILDILDAGGRPLEQGLQCAVNIQLNRNILTAMPGVLFFQSSDPQISYADKLSLGTSVKLFYFSPQP